jgi:hypothetical protein
MQEKREIVITLPFHFPGMMVLIRVVVKVLSVAYHAMVKKKQDETE